MALSNPKRSLADANFIYMQDFLFYWNLSFYQCSITPTHFHCHIICLRWVEISRFYLSHVSNFRNFFKLFYLYYLGSGCKSAHFTDKLRASRTTDSQSWTGRKYYSFSRPITNTIESALFTLAISTYKIEAKKGKLFKNEFSSTTVDQSPWSRDFSRWFKNERLPKSDDFRPTTVGTTHIIQSGHMMACWKAESLNYVEKILSDIF